MRKALLLITILSLGFQFSYGQFTISGKVYDVEDNTPLSGANIVINKSNFGVASDSDGNFTLGNLKKGKYTITVSFVGYSKYEETIKLEDNLEIEVKLSPNPYLIDNVIVSSTRIDEKTPMTFSKVTDADIEKQNFTQDFPYILNYQPSLVTTSDAGAGIGYTGLRIRGSDQTRINVTINGIPLNDAESQGVFWVNTPDLASSIHDIQTQRGVGSSTNGPGAFGASLNIQTDNFNEKPYADLVGAFGSFNSQRYTLKAGTGLIKDHFTFDARLSRISSDGYVDRAETNLNSWYTSAAYYGKSTLIKFNILSGNEKTYQSWWGVPESRLNDDLEGMNDYIIRNGLDAEEATNLLTSGRTYNYYTYDDQTDNYGQDHYQLFFSQDFGDKFSLNTAFFHTHGEGYFEEYRKDDPLSLYLIDDVIVGGDTITNSDLIRRRWLNNDLYGFNFSVGYDVEELNIVLGGGYSDYTGDHYGELLWVRFAGDSEIRDRFYDNVGDKTDFNIYLKATYLLSNRWNLFADFQYRNVNYKANGLDIGSVPIDVNDKLSFFNPKLGLTYLINEKSDVYGSYSIGNREPVRNDYIDSPQDRQPKPENLQNVELGYRLRSKRITFMANYYLMLYKDQLVLTGELNDVGNGIRTNVDDSYRTGVELVLGLRPSNKWLIEANATFSQNRIREFEEYIYDYGDNFDEFNEVVRTYNDTDIAFSPSIISGGSVSYFPIPDLELSWLFKYVGKQYLDNTSNENRVISPYFVNDLRFIYSIYPSFMNKIVFSLMVNNIFNNLYESNGYTYGYIGGGEEVRENLYYPQAGTNFMASVSFSF